MVDVFLNYQPRTCRTKNMMSREIGWFSSCKPFVGPGRYLNLFGWLPTSQFCFLLVIQTWLAANSSRFLLLLMTPQGTLQWTNIAMENVAFIDDFYDDRLLIIAHSQGYTTIFGWLIPSLMLKTTTESLLGKKKTRGHWRPPPPASDPAAVCSI